MNPPEPASWSAPPEPSSNRLVVLRRAAQFVVRRVPLTLGTSIVIAAIAARSGSLTADTPEATIQRWGFDLDNFVRGHVLTLATMNFFVFNRSHLIAVLILLWCFLAPLEVWVGTRAAAYVFWASTLVGAFLSALLVALPGHFLGWRPVPNLIEAADVGSSIGGAGAAGGLTVTFEQVSRPAGWAARIGIGIFLLSQLRSSPGIADVEHVAGYLIGITVAYRLRLNQPPVRTRQPAPMVS